MQFPIAQRSFSKIKILLWQLAALSSSLQSGADTILTIAVGPLHACVKGFQMTLLCVGPGLFLACGILYKGLPSACCVCMCSMAVCGSLHVLGLVQGLGPLHVLGLLRSFLVPAKCI
eukprot:c19336_g1_i1 orf=239-589(+)